MRFVGVVVAATLSAGMPVPAAASETAQALLRDGVAAYRAGAPARAFQVFAAAAAKAPGDALPALWAGSAAAASGQWDSARDYFREALRRPHTPVEGRLAEAWLMRLEALNTRIPGSVDPQLGIAALAYASNPRLTRSQATWLGQAVEAAAGREALDPWLLAAV
ncbi:MAG TPA: hypothetical protein VJT32_08170, partial [bacterium]|nr:hypothetical protein [bacterium]